MANASCNAPSRVRKYHAKFAYIANALTRFRHWWRQPKVPDLTHLPDHLIDDIGLSRNDPRRVPPKPWIWVDYIPRG